MAVPSLTRAVTERGQSHLSFDRLSTYAIISKHPLADLHKHGGLCTHTTNSSSSSSFLTACKRARGHTIGRVRVPLGAPRNSPTAVVRTQTAIALDRKVMMCARVLYVSFFQVTKKLKST